MSIKNYFLLLPGLCAFCIAPAQSKTTFTDPRDKQVYTYVTYENIKIPDGKPLTWMSQNLNYKLDSGTRVYPLPEKGDSRKKQGLLYTWQGATRACPVGWHLPTDQEWQQLIDTFGNNETAGRSLKSGSGWANNGQGENLSGFNAGPGGYYEAEDDRFSMYYTWVGFWWTATAQDASTANVQRMNYISNAVTPLSKAKADGYAVRCVKD